MATPQTVIHGSAPARDALVQSTLLGLVLLNLWELPRLAAQHGGLTFVGAWGLCLAGLALPLLLLEFMLGRRSRRSPLEGLAFLTREADARRLWRSAAWGAALAALLALAAVALVAGGQLNFLVAQAGAAAQAVTAASAGGLALPLGSGGLLVLGAGGSLLASAWQARLQAGGLVLVTLLLAGAALAGLGTAEALYAPRALTAADWAAAARLALLGCGGGLGVLWVGGMRLVREARLGPLALGVLAVQLCLAALLLAALAPFVAAAQVNALGGAAIVPAGPAAWLLQGALLLAALLLLPRLAEPLLLRLAEKGLARLPAVLLVFAPATLLAEAVWWGGQAAGVLRLLAVLGVVLLLVQAVQSVFAGWAMKISHARKELALPREGIYNLWRVAVRLVLPLTVLWLLARRLA